MIHAFTALLLLAAAPKPTAAPALEQSAIHIRAAIDGGRLAQAEAMVQRLPPEALVKPDAKIRALLADLRLAQKRQPEALALFAELATEQPDNAHFVGRHGLILLQLGSASEAETALRKASTLAGADWTTLNALGVVLDRKRDWAGSEAAYARALQLTPTEAAVPNNYGYSLLLQRRFAEARDMLDRARRLNPKDERVELNRQLAAAMAGDYPTAKAEGETAAAWAARLNNAGYAAWLAGDVESARALLARAVEASEAHNEKAARNLELVEKAAAK